MQRGQVTDLKPELDALAKLLSWSEHCPDILTLWVQSPVRAHTHTQESTSEFINMCNNKLMFLSLKSLNKKKLKET